MSSFENQSLKNPRQFKGTILLDSFLATGHINAFRLLGEWLFENGYRIVCLGIPSKKIVDEFEWYPINSFLFVPNIYEFKQKGFLRCLLDNIFESRHKKSLSCFREATSDYDKLMEEINPDLILLDEHYAYKALFYQRYNVSIITISTMTLPLMATKTPPFQSTYIPNDTNISNAIIKGLRLKIRVKQFVKRLKMKILCLGESDLILMKKLCPNSTFTYDTQRCFGTGISELPVIAVYPKTFDFNNDFYYKKEVFYFGRLPTQMSSEIEDNRLLSILNRVKRENSYGTRKSLLYCSLGTITVDYLRVCHTFFKKIVTVASLNPTIEFILSVGRGYDISQLGKTPANLAVFSFVPQIQLLKHVNIMINHGGINSIKECIEENIPMICYPLSPDWDQPGCAARVVYHQLGLMGNIRKDNIRKINLKIRVMISNLNGYKQNLAEFKEKVEVDNSIEESKILSIINGSISNNKSTNNFFYDASLPTKIKQNSC